MARKMRVGVIFGGRSGEHEVSVRSARAVIDALDVKKYEAVPVAIARAGEWLSPAESAAMLPEETRRLLGPDVLAGRDRPAAIFGDPSGGGSAPDEARAER
ncbi:MAG TPA: hypothetical protein VF723_03040, partial [Pyrinomonadaceae bacterium]